MVLHDLTLPIVSAHYFITIHPRGETSGYFYAGDINRRTWKPGLAHIGGCINIEYLHVLYVPGTMYVCTFKYPHMFLDSIHAVTRYMNIVS